jgi:hypothetical protein
MAAPSSPPRISVNKPKVSSLPLYFIAAILALLPLAGHGGMEWGTVSSGGDDSGEEKGPLLQVLRRGAWKRLNSEPVKPLRWGWTGADSLAKALCNKRFWLRCCILDVLDIDLAGRGGEEEDEDDGDYVSTCG